MYTVKLQDFEGPLDLLLFFIKRDELDVYNIPISGIAREFLDYIHYMESLDLEVAGEFLVIAAELMQVKVKMLLPPEPGQEEELDPRANLVKRLIEYKRYKEIAGSFAGLAEEQGKVFSRGFREADEKIVPEVDDRDLLRDVTLFDLIASFKFAVEKMPKKFVHEVIRIQVTIDQQLKFVRDYFSRKSESTFRELISEMEEKIKIIVTFLALLELIRSKEIVAKQTDPFGELSLIRSVE